MGRQKTYESKPKSELVPLPQDWLHIDGVEVEGIIAETDRLIVVQARTCNSAMPLCPTCKSNSAVIKWATRPIDVHDTERNGKLVWIVLLRQRFKCETCGTFTPPLPFLDGRRKRRTARLGDRTRRLVNDRRTTSDVAVDTGMSRRTVQIIAVENGRGRHTPQEVFRRATLTKNAACVINIDDSHPSLGACTAILLNGKPLQLLEHYNIDAVESFFISLPAEGRDKVLVYVSDTAPFLLRLGRKYFRNARIVADPYHVIRKALECFDPILKDFETSILERYSGAIKEGSLVRPIVGRGRKEQESTDSIGQIKRPNDPKIGEIKLLLHTKAGELQAEHRAAVDFLLAAFPDLRPAYFYLQGVMGLYHRRISANKASRRLDKLSEKLPATLKLRFKKFLKYSLKHRQAICEFWRCGWTNAEVEAQNGVIANIDDCGRGLKFPELRRRWLYGRSASATLDGLRMSSSSKLDEKAGPKKKGIRELRTLPPPSPVPISGPQGQIWLFDQDADEQPEDE
jgi:transposase